MPATTSAENLLAQLNWRYATKKFDPARKIPADTWQALEQAAGLAPSSYGFEPWRFIVVTDPALREKLKSASWNQPQITDASHLMVFTRRQTMTIADVDALVARAAKARGVAPDTMASFHGMLKGFVEGNRPPGGDWSAWTARQTYIALGFFLSAAAAMGIDTCPMEGFDPAQYDQLLGLTGTGYTATVLAPAGYRAADDKYAHGPKVRRPLAEVVVRK